MAEGVVAAWLASTVVTLARVVRMARAARAIEEGMTAVSRSSKLATVAAARPKVLQSRGNTINKSTAKALGLTPEQAKNAMHKLKPFVGADNRNVGKIMSNGDYVDRETGEVLGNLYDFVD